MAFGLNRVELIGRLGVDVTVNHLTSGGRVANLSIATDESYINRQNGERVDKTEWHRIVTFQDGLVEMLGKHAHKGRLVYVDGKLQTRRCPPPIPRAPARPCRPAMATAARTTKSRSRVPSSHGGRRFGAGPPFLLPYSSPARPGARPRFARVAGCPAPP